MPSFCTHSVKRILRYAAPSSDQSLRLDTVMVVAASPRLWLGKLLIIGMTFKRTQDIDAQSGSIVVVARAERIAFAETMSRTLRNENGVLSEFDVLRH